MIKDHLEALFVKQEEHEVKKDLVLSATGLPADSNALLTRTIKSVFPMATTRRDRENGIWLLIYTSLMP